MLVPSVLVLHMLTCRSVTAWSCQTGDPKGSKFWLFGCWLVMVLPKSSRDGLCTLGLPVAFVAWV